MTEHDESGELMYIRCAYCREWIGVKPGNMGDVSHTVCDKCMAKLVDENGKSRLAPHPDGESPDKKTGA